MKNFLKYIRESGCRLIVLIYLAYVLSTGYPWIWASHVTAKMMELTGWIHTVAIYVQSGVIASVCLVVLLVMYRKERSQNETGATDIK